MRFEYYHGTRNLFLKSIKENGLGAINPTFDNQTLELLKYLYGVCENSLFSCSEYDISTRETILAMIKQTSLITKVNGNVTKFNFRHKNIYVSLSEFKAVIYASTNKYGSEVLQQCVKLYELLIKHNVSFEIPSEINFYNIQISFKHNIRLRLQITEKVFAKGGLNGTKSSISTNRSKLLFQIVKLQKNTI